MNNWKKRNFENRKIKDLKLRSFQFLKFFIFSNFQYFFLDILSRLGPDWSLVPDNNLDMKNTDSGRNLVSVMDNSDRKGSLETFWRACEMQMSWDPWLVQEIRWLANWTDNIEFSWRNRIVQFYIRNRDPFISMQFQMQFPRLDHQYFSRSPISPFIEILKVFMASTVILVARFHSWNRFVIVSPGWNLFWNRSDLLLIFQIL